MRAFRFLLPIIPPLLWLQCAGQIPPPGGPVDSIPPVIIRTIPDTNATRVTENYVELRFSEYVDRRSVEESIFISPPVEILEYDWSGEEVTIFFADTLRKNTTYVVSVGTDVIDRRAGNRMAAGYSLAFSSGDSLDRGIIAGRVVDTEPAGVMIFAYLLDLVDPDTLNPATVQPHYVMQTGTKGEFLMANVAFGSYRVMAVRDQYKNLLYDKQTDQFGMFWRDVHLSDASARVDNVWFRLFVEDTTAPFLSSVQALNDRLIRFRFSEPIDSASFARSRITITDTLTGGTIDQLLSFQDANSGISGGLVTSSSLQSSAMYQLMVEGVTDSSGIGIDSSNAALLFKGSAVADTIPPVFNYLSFSDTLLGFPLNRSLDIGFSEPVRKTPFDGGIRLLGDQEQEIALQLDWLSPVRLSVRPGQPLAPGVLYHLEVALDSVQDLAGNSLSDSLVSVSFLSYDPNRAGELEGMVRDRHIEDESAIFVWTTRVTDRWTRETEADGEMKFHFKSLAPGRYIIAGFRDGDQSSDYSYGVPFPFRPSERFVVGSDTLRVRARWAVEGVVLSFP